MNALNRVTVNDVCGVCQTQLNTVPIHCPTCARVLCAACAIFGEQDCAICERTMSEAKRIAAEVDRQQEQCTLCYNFNNALQTCKLCSRRACSRCINRIEYGRWAGQPDGMMCCMCERKTRCIACHASLETRGLVRGVCTFADCERIICRPVASLAHYNKPDLIVCHAHLPNCAGCDRLYHATKRRYIQLRSVPCLIAACDVCFSALRDAFAHTLLIRMRVASAYSLPKDVIERIVMFAYPWLRKLERK